MSAKEPAAKWYYDACTLDPNLGTFGEIVNKRATAYTSNLALGESFANSLRKDPESLESFIDLIKKLRETGIEINIVGNDEIEKLISQIKELCPRLSLTDSVHLATALREGCCVFRTIDSDFDDVTTDIQKQLANKHGMSTFSIVQMNPANKTELFKAKKAMRRKGV